MSSASSCFGCRGWDDWWVWSGTAGTRDISAHGLEELLSCRSRVRAGTGSVPRLAQHSEGSLRTHAFTPGFQREGHKCTGCSECFQHLRADWLSFTWNWWMSKGSQSMGYAKIYLDSCGRSQTMANLLLPQIFFLLNEIWVVISSSNNFLIVSVTACVRHTWKEMQNLNSFQIEAPRPSGFSVSIVFWLVVSHISKKAASPWLSVDMFSFNLLTLALTC